MIFNNKKILLTILHDLIALSISFILALWLRLENDSLILLKELWLYLLFFLGLNVFFFNRFGLYHGIWRYASFQEILSIFKGLLASSLLIIAGLFLTIRLESIPRSFPILLFIVSFLGISGPRVLYRLLKDNLINLKQTEKKNKVPVLVAGDGNTTELFIRSTNKQIASPFNVIGIIGKKNNSIGRTIHGIPIVMSLEKLKPLKKVIFRNNIQPQRIIITDHTLNQELIESLFVFSKQNGLAIGELPRATDFKPRNQENFKTNPIEIEDILGRKQKVHDVTSLKNIKDKLVMVTGAGGSIGSELCKQIMANKPKKIILLENSELNLYKVYQNLDPEHTLPILGDVRDKFKIEQIIEKEKPEIVFHSAALKHITFVEDDVLEGLKTNFLGTVNIVQSCIKYNVKKMIFISTDKAVNPSTIMGATKRLCEKYIQQISQDSKTKFKILRFGNVLGSTGSIVPLFQNQIDLGLPLTVTHPETSRYFMTIREAVELILISSQEGKINNSEINILDMGKPVKIKDLAIKMINLSGKQLGEDIKIIYTKLRKGEKLHEELVYKNEIINVSSTKEILKTQTILNPINNKDIDKIERAIKKNNKKLCKQLLKFMLPEYKI